MTLKQGQLVNSKKTIGLWSCVAFAVGAMVGAGVFVLSGVAVNDAGPLAIWSFIIAGICVLCSAFSSMLVGSLAQAGELGYAPVGRALGHRFWGFLASWAFYLAAIVGMAFVLNAFGAYMHDFFTPTINPLWWSLAATALLALVNLGKTSAIGKIEGALVIVKVAILLVLIGFGLAHISSGALHATEGHNISSTLHTSGLLFIAYLGFNVITNIAGDVRDPRKTIPKAIFISVFAVLLLYIGVVVTLLAFPLTSYNEASVGQIAKELMGPIGGVLVPIAALVSTLSAANSNILSSSEIMVRLAARKDVPTVAGRMYNGHPLFSVVFASLVCAALLISRKTELVVSLANVAAILGIIMVNIAAINILRKKISGAMRLPGGALLPAVGLISCIAELGMLGLLPNIWGLACIGAGGLLYLGRKYFHNPAYHKELTAELERYGGPVLRAMRKMEGHI